VDAIFEAGKFSLNQAWANYPSSKKSSPALEGCQRAWGQIKLKL